MKTAYITTLCNGDGYVPGVETLGKSLEAHGTKVPRIVLVTADVTEKARKVLTEQGWEVREVEPLENPNPGTAQLFERFRNVYTKLRAWQLVDFDKVVVLDADVITLQNIDELFERPSIAAAPDFFLPDRFNSGLMVIDPSTETFERMLEALWESTRSIHALSRTKRAMASATYPESSTGSTTSSGSAWRRSGCRRSLKALRRTSVMTSATTSA